MRQPLILALFCVLLSHLTPAQTHTVTITEPGVYELGDLFKTADIVALVRILSGDAENYSCAIYKGEVVQNFKGSQKGAIFYFGPFTGLRLGDEYILFLRNVDQEIEPKKKVEASYGAVHYSRVFDEGYSSMETSYECVFDGDEIAQKCDYGVRICTDYIKLPKSMPAFPPEEVDPPFGCRWVRKSTFLYTLGGLGKEKK
jgi:hypothetical protein